MERKILGSVEWKESRTEDGQLRITSVVFSDGSICQHDGDRYEMVSKGVFEWRCAECGILTGAMPFHLPVGYPPYA